MKTPQEVARLAQIAMAIEPLPNKEGLTTRFKDKEDTLKLEYFIIAAINSGNAIRELMWRPEFTPSYNLLVNALTDNLLNRGGYRVNSGQVIMLWPILTTLRDYRCKNTLDLQDNLIKHFKDVRSLDVYNFQIACEFSKSLWEGHQHRRKVIFASDTLYEYFEKSPEDYFETELRKGLPTVFEMYNDLDQEAPYTQEMERIWVKFRDESVFLFPEGHIADYMAIAVFLAMYFDDYKIR